MNTRSEYVVKIFNTIAPVYDLINQIMSFGMHLKWKNIAIDQLEMQKGDKILDLCCGSGDITALILEKAPEKLEIYSVDFSSEMLKLAENRFKVNPEVKIIQADALQLPFEESFFDRVIISFGLRNLESYSEGLAGIYRVLKNGGVYVNIDFGKPDLPLISTLFNFYFHYFVPVLGLIFKKFKQYAYLPDSIDKFPSPGQLLKLMKEQGFVEVTNKDIFWGFVAVQKGVKKN